MFDTLLQLDGQLLLAIQSLHVSWLDPIVSLYTRLGNAGLLWIALSLAMLCYKPTRRAGALALGDATDHPVGDVAVTAPASGV